MNISKKITHLIVIGFGTGVGIGAGLGLSIANNITLSHGGYLELLKSPENGLRVKISLPI